MSKNKTQSSTNPSSLFGSLGPTSIDSFDFEFSVDPQKYIDEIESSIKKHKDLSHDFQRFIQ